MIACAYYDRERDGGYCHPLLDHSRNVALAIHKIFKDRLRSVPPAARIPVVSDRLGEIAVLAGVAHDLGKASAYYQERVRRGERGGFQYHEYVGALVLLAAAKSLLEHGEEYAADATLALVAAGVVARHHVAMRHRHPTILLGSTFFEERGFSVERERRSFRDELYNAVMRLDRDTVARNIPLQLAPSTISGIILDAVDQAKTYTKDMMISTLKEAIPVDRLGEIVYGGRNTQPLIPARDPGTARHVLTGIVYSLSGALIVADILVAGCERRPGEGPEKAYARSWMRELFPGWDPQRVCDELTRAG